MAERTLYRKTLGGFAPFNDAAQDNYGRLKLGDVVELKPIKVRNGKYHRLFFAIIKLISENSEPSLNPDAVLYYAKWAAGVGEVIKNPRTGAADFVPGSISFANMDGAAFEQFVKTAITPLCARFLHGIDHKDVIQEAMQLAR